MRISDWSSDVCSSDLLCERGDGYRLAVAAADTDVAQPFGEGTIVGIGLHLHPIDPAIAVEVIDVKGTERALQRGEQVIHRHAQQLGLRSQEHTSELQSLMRISYAAFCLQQTPHQTFHTHLE